MSFTFWKNNFQFEGEGVVSGSGREGVCVGARGEYDAEPKLMDVVEYQSIVDSRIFLQLVCILCI